MKAKYRYILAFVVLALVAAVLIWKYTFRKSDSSVAAQKATVEITASKMLEAYEMDENAANALYLDKVVVVSGIIDSISMDTLGVTLYLKESDAAAGVICSFDKSAIDVSLVKKGLPVSIKGICTGYLMDVVMNKCALESGGKN